MHKTSPSTAAPSAGNGQGPGVEAGPAPPPVQGAGHEPRRRRGGFVWGLVIVGGLILVGLALVATAAVVWTSGRSSDSRSETFGAGIERVIVEDVNGDVALQVGTTTEVRVDREWLLTGAPEVKMVEEDGTLHISARCGAFCRTHVSGTAPAGAEIVVRTEAGDIDVGGFERGVDLATSAGRVTVTGISGGAVLRSEAGGISGDVTDGDVDAETSAGRIDLAVRGRFSRVSAVSDAGSIELAVPDDVYRVDAETSAGRTVVDVATDPDADRQIVARSSAGNVVVERLPG